MYLSAIALSFYPVNYKSYLENNVGALRSFQSPFTVSKLGVLATTVVITRAFNLKNKDNETTTDLKKSRKRGPNTTTHNTNFCLYSEEFIFPL